MKIGISEWSLHQHFGRMVRNPRPWKVADLVDLAGQWQLDAVQLESIPDDPAQLAAIRRRAEALGLTIEVEACTIHPDKLRAKLEAAKALGSEVVRTFPDLNRYRKDVPLKAQMDEAVDRLRAVAVLARELGVYVGVENHQALVLDRVEYQDISGPELADVLDRVDSPFVGVCLDLGNPFGFFDDPLDTARRLAPRTVTVHFKDYRIQRTFRGAEFAGCPWAKAQSTCRPSSRC
jgi:3-oxoisoapionate decarboxylase